MLNNTEALEIIRQKIQQVGGVAQFEAKYDVQSGHLKAIIAGRTEPGRRTAKAAGLVKQDGAWRWM